MEHPTKTLPAVPVPELSPERRLLWEAANYIEEHGLSRGGATDIYGRRCVIAAILEVGGNHDRAASYAIDLLQVRLNSTGVNKSIPHWSDTAGDKQIVVKTLRDCAVSS